MFKQLQSTNNTYEINEEATIRRVDNHYVVHKYIGTDCYEHVVLFYNKKRHRIRVHRLMSEAFFNNHKPIDHIDMNRSNNHISNLRAISYAENNHKRHETKSVTAINKTTGETIYCKSMRECERITGVDRHRIKHFLDEERNNYTEWDFKRCND